MSALLVTAWLATQSGAALAASTEPHRLYYESILGGRVNPAGFQLRTTGYTRHRLLDRPADDVLFGDTWVGIGPTVAVSPAFLRGGVQARLVPIALLRLTARWEGIGYFGSFNQMLSWPGTEVQAGGTDATPAGACTDPSIGCAPVDYSDGAMEALGAAGRSYPTKGWQGLLEARLQAKAGPIAVRSTFGAVRTHVELRAGDSVFYDQTYDVLMANDGWTLNNDADLLFVGIDDWIVGARLSSVHAIHDDDSDADQWTQRVGPLIAHKFKGSRGFHQPTVYVLPQWWLQHNYRTGAETSQSMPQIVVGLGWSGDLLPAG